jgi:hypothetical protein
MHLRGWLLACVPLLFWSDDLAAAKWHANLETARNEAKKLNRPLFVVFRCEH